jgi:glucose-1-phosphate cytidylyltransferase
MKAIILAGGLGTRISEETVNIPKPMIEIGGHPILWNIMKIYSHYGINDFIICLGYKGEVIKEFFLRYHQRNSDLTIDLRSGALELHNSSADPWRVSLIDTGLETMTGGRLKRIAPYVGNEPFCMTYGDGVSDVDIGKLIAFHKAHGKLATVTAVRQPSRFGTFELDESQVMAVREKASEDGTWINGGFFVLNPGVFDYIAGDGTIWEREPMERLARDGQMMAHFHSGFWQPMDTLREKNLLEQLWHSGSPPWKVWG